jgi:hypothetical protein
MKTKTIILHKNEIHYDCEAHAYKLMDVIGTDIKIKNAVAADSGDVLDGRMLSRYTDLRDAEVRKALAFCLEDRSIDTIDDRPSTCPSYSYVVNVSDEFKDAALLAIRTHLHEYLVRGTLHDWYKGCGIGQNPIDPQEVESLLEKAVADLRGKSWMKAPMQPFGPRYKMH